MRKWKRDVFLVNWISIWALLKSPWKLSWKSLSQNTIPIVSLVIRKRGNIRCGAGLCADKTLSGATRLGTIQGQEWSCSTMSCCHPEQALKCDRYVLVKFIILPVGTQPECSRGLSPTLKFRIQGRNPSTRIRSSVSCQPNKRILVTCLSDSEPPV